MVDKISMDTFGPVAWQFLHYVSINYPDYPTLQDKINYKNFMISIQNILPCNVCAVNYKKHLEELPLTDEILSSRDLFIRWVIDMHNIVNKIKNKPILSYDEAIKAIFSNHLQSNLQNSNLQSNIQNNLQSSNLQNNNIEHFNSENNKIEQFQTNSENTCSTQNYIIILILILTALLFIAIFYKKK